VTLYWAILGALAVGALWAMACGVLWLALATKPPEFPSKEPEALPHSWRARKTGTRAAKNNNTLS
jgi:hypothetical protein